MLNPTAARDDAYGAPAEPSWREVEWVRHQRRAQLDAGAINFISVGAGPPVLLVHGHDGSWRNWLENIPRLARTHRVIAPDLPGFGASPLPAEEITIRGYARALASLCADQGLQRVALVGNSMGGLVCAELALSEPALVERLILVAPAGVSRRYGGLPLWVLGSRVMPTRLLTRANRSMAVRARAVVARRRLRRASMARSVAHPELINPALAAHVIDAAGAAGSVAAGAAVIRHHIADRLGAIRCPTLILWGADDAMIGVEAADAWTKLIPGSRRLILADTGHLPMLERPTRFNALVEEFLDGHGA